MTQDVVKPVDLQALVVEADQGGRKLAGASGKLLFGVAVAWSLFQLWYASPLPYLLGAGVLNDSQARCIHLSFALFIAFVAYPGTKGGVRHRVPLLDWALAAISIGAVVYLIVFYRDLAERPGLPTTLDIVASVSGVVLLLEASRRAEGPWMPAISILMLAYVFLGPHLPGLMSHKGASLGRAASQFWLTSEGVFGVALGVSTSFIFLFVLFGALLEKAGAGNWFIQLAFSLLGHYRGGPAKAGVVSSGLTGLISGSSVANVVTTGTFTIPLMKRVGYTPTKAGAIECAAGVNGQIMPPVMGAAAFLMAEYVGISYADVCKHAFLPAIITYGALFYIVDIEAVKDSIAGVPRTHAQAFAQAALKTLLTLGGLIILGGLVYTLFGWTKAAFGDAATWGAIALLLAGYLGLVALRAKHPDLAVDDPNSPLVRVPEFFATARTGLHYLIPVLVLIWCMLVEELSPGLSAFYGCVFMMGMVLSQHALTALFRREGGLARQWARGARELVAGLEAGGRNMAAVGIATATAGIMVGTVTLTGVGLVMAEIVETVSGGNVVIMLALTALICLVLGAGLPTTASYVVVATLMAPVVVELAAQNDLAIPLIAVHMFVFYFGLMADVTPPVGLAAYAAGAIAGADPMKVGWQASLYEIRTGLLPFIFVFNTELLLIDLSGPGHFLLVLVSTVLAMGAFVAASQGWLVTRNRWYETIALLLACFILFRPGYWLDLIAPPFAAAAPAELLAQAAKVPPEGTLRLRLAGEDRDGDPVEKLVRLRLEAGASPADRLRATGMSVSPDGSRVQTVRLGSQAARLGVRQGDEIKAVLVPTERVSAYWFTLPGFAIYGAVFLLQRGRRGRLAMA